MKNGISEDLLSEQKEQEEKEAKLEKMKRLQEEKEKRVRAWWDQRVNKEIEAMSEEEKEKIWKFVKEIAGSLSLETQQNIFRSRVKTKLESQGVKPSDKE
ncbi:hypothetical protein [Caldisericum exile]|uniref:hypothetical protein n=1 Tax=Caldisericum exile TaxID=693075 RepID=UPI0012E9A6F2|nr:hypothetical protein [Caldisericum exile]